MQKTTKWTKCFVVEVFENGFWKTMTRPMTELQAMRLMLTDRILCRFYDINKARVVKVEY
jgi:hypothetical protein